MSSSSNAWHRVSSGLGYGTWERASNVSPSRPAEHHESLADHSSCKAGSIYNLQPSGFAAGFLRKSDRKGVFLGADEELPTCNGVHFTSASTIADGACGLHAQYGVLESGSLSLHGGQLELRQR